MYRFHATVDKGETTLQLLREGEVVGERRFAEKRDMSERLPEAVEGLLSEHRLAPGDVAAFEVDSRMPETFTSARIAQTVARVYTFATSAQKKETENTAD